MSGGIDSTAAVLLLRQMGYNPIGLYIDMLGCEKSCRSVSELCQELEIDLIIAPATNLFEREVIEVVTAQHNAGKTPSPCTICNPAVKWALLKEYADKLSIHYLATGHYVNIESHNSHYYVSAGIDSTKDQSYYLYNLSQDVLCRALTPLGSYTKSSIRALLQQHNLGKVCENRESQGVCFASGGGYREFISRNCMPTAGNVIDTVGNIVGCHDGYQLYTIGQRRGFSLSNPAYKAEVRSINALHNTITVGEPLLCRQLTIEKGWFRPISNDMVRAKIRGIGKNPTSAVDVSEIADGSGRYSVLLRNEDTFWAPTPGQPTVLYQGDIVVGGGVVE